MKPYVMKGDQFGSGAIDFSYLLDAPAGKHGFVTTKDGHFYFTNGSRIRFFGVNLVFGAAMPDREMAVNIAERLAKSGINMVRFHHVDSHQLGEHTSTLIDYSNNNSQKLHEQNFDRFDFLLSELKKRGIYFHIDLFTLRKYLPGDELDYEDELGGALKHVNYYNNRLIELHKKFIKQYLTHKNPYTGLRYMDDPAVAVVQLLNENSIFWENGDCRIPSYKKELDRKWNEYLLKKYGSRDGLDNAWTKEDGIKALAADEDPAQGTVRRAPVGFWGEKKVNYNANYADIEGPARFADNAEFLSGIEISYFKEMMAYLRELGVKCPIDGSNLPGGAAELRCLATADVTENNVYWNHPMGGFRVPVTFHTMEMYASDPRNMRVEAFGLNYMTRLSHGKVEGKPFIVTEWNTCYPTKFRADAMLMLSSYASLQDWDGLLLFSYAHSGGKEQLTSEKMSGFFNSYNDPALWGLAGVASAIFQEGLVKTANNLVEICYTDNDCKATPHTWSIPFGVVPFVSRIAARLTGDGKYEGSADVALSSGFTSTGDYTAAKHALVYARSPYKDMHQKQRSKDAFLAMHRDTSALEPVKDIDGNVIGEIGDKSCILSNEEGIDKKHQNFSVIFDQCMKKWNLYDQTKGLTDQGTLVSDTGELVYGFGSGKFTITTPKVASYTGRISGPVTVGEYELDLNNAKASVTIMSKDGKELKDSRHLLITAIGESENANMVWEGNTLTNEGTGPVMIDQITGSIYIPSSVAECKAYSLDQRGARAEELPVEKSCCGFTVKLDNKESAIYYEVVLA